ncbi:MAG: 50S ribosomal protein L4 [Patescibacteria group bacterium]|nr:50S ribosomal protein L4 [Patescibacteria group bacterium]
METKVYNQNGQEAGKISIPERVFGVGWNADLVHQVVSSIMTNSRDPIAHTKTRGEVRGGGRKPWQQKGLGRARHGSTRSPIWVGGGVTHGPRNDKNFDRKVNKKMKAKALYSIISKKFNDGEVLFVEDFSITAPKTKEAKNILISLSKIKGYEKLANKRKNSAFIGLGGKSQIVSKSFANLGNVLVTELRNLNPVTALSYKYLIVVNPNESIKTIDNKI